MLVALLMLAWGMALGVAEEASGGELAEAETTARGDAPPLPSGSPGADRGWVTGGHLELGVDAAGARGQTDINLRQSLRLQLAPPKSDRIRFEGWVWLDEDLGSRQPQWSVLRDINESWDSSVRVRVPQLYLEVDDLWGDSTLRVGRQRIREGKAYSRIDGVYFKQTLDQWNWYAFFGARASLYDDHLFQDLVYGGGVAHQVLPTTRVALDAYYAQQRRRDSDVVRPGIVPFVLGRPYPRRVRKELGDNLYTLSIWQDLGLKHRLFAQFTLNNGESDELLLDLTGTDLVWDLSYQVTYRSRLQRIGERVNDLAYFYRVLGPYEKFDNLLVHVQKPITDRLIASLEAEFHESDGESVPYSTNRDHERYAFILTMKDLQPGLDVSAGLERWDVSAGESLWAVTGEVKKTWERVEASVGLDYQRYKDALVQYNPYPYWLYQRVIYAVPGLYQGFAPGVRLLDEWTVTTKENVYGVYMQVKWSVGPNQELRARVMYEEDDGPQSPYWRVQSEYTIRF